MKTRLLGLLILPALVGVVSTHSQAADPPGWKQSATIKVPKVPTKVFLSEDHRFVFVQHEEKSDPFFMGGTSARVATYRILRCYNAETGKELFNENLDLVQGRLREMMCIQGNTLAMNDDTDAIHLWDLTTFKASGQLDTTTDTDGPPNYKRKVNGDTRLGHFQITADGKTLVTVREEAEWKKDAKAPGGYIGSSYQQIAFWDIEKKTKTDTLDCEDKEARRGHLTLLRKSNAMLVKFDNGARILDLTTRKWGLNFPVKDVYSVIPSPNEKLVAITDHAQNVKTFELETGKEISSFKETPISRRAYTDRTGKPVAGSFETGPVTTFTEDEKVLRLLLNDGKAVVYRDSATGKDVKKPAETETPAFPGNEQVLAWAKDREQAVTAPFRSPPLTVWRSSKLSNETLKEKEQK